MGKYARKYSIKEVKQAFLNISKDILRILIEKGLILRKIKITFDFYKELYYGKNDCPYVLGIKAGNGSKKAHIYHTCCIILKGRELLVGCKMIKKGMRVKQFVQKMIEFLESLVFIIELVVMDK
ncbi:MAG: hypothetical protein ACTSRP_17805 [Candidatus Helarchaeota archaeon]